MFPVLKLKADEPYQKYNSANIIRAARKIQEVQDAEARGLSKEMPRYACNPVSDDAAPVALDGLRTPIIDRLCRWPIDGALYCGCEARDGMTYCPTHAAVSIAPARRTPKQKALVEAYKLRVAP